MKFKVVSERLAWTGHDEQWQWWLGLERPRSCGQWQELTAVRLCCSVGTSRQAEQSVSVAPRHTSNTNIHLTINLIAGPSSIISSATATQQPQLDYCRVLCPKTFITGHLCIRVCFLIYKASRRSSVKWQWEFRGSVCICIHLGRASDGVDSVGYRQTGDWWPPPAENSCSFPLGSHCPELGSGEGRPVAAAVWHVQAAGHRISILILINTTQAWTQSHKTLFVLWVKWRITHIIQLQCQVQLWMAMNVCDISNIYTIRYLFARFTTVTLQWIVRKHWT